jgi:hypothetical protein
VIGKMSGAVVDPTEMRAAGLAPIAPGLERAFLVEAFNRILIAMRVWPTSGRREILAWDLADGEEDAAWLKFLSRLAEQRICRSMARA